MSSPLINTNWPRGHGLRVGHLNICHIVNKIADVARILDNNDNPFHIFGFSESWTKANISNALLSIPGYEIIRRDSQKTS